MAEKNDQLIKAKALIKQLYNSTDDTRLQAPLMKAYKRLEEGTDVIDLVAHAASAVNYIRLTEEISLTAEQEKLWRELRDLGSAAILYHDPKNNLLDLSEK
ncbi:hypothetical protein [Companilactobacillus heilongjiangensis]|uniref:Bacteriocin immunity protein n=1 Tax=Companilactobacillus heilongjiangensis TaxID=1074467 RepID=A0A0K2LEW0_9LACO|nr:hypothetical protein [Companilactobacillus heilongjiangensis]ALB29841.1 hypothetical protein JP39_11030 [Companilactobacillus heilongjiangensis]